MGLLGCWLLSAWGRGLGAADSERLTGAHDPGHIMGFGSLQALFHAAHPLNPYDHYLYAAVVMLGTLGAVLVVVWLVGRRLARARSGAARGGPPHQRAGRVVWSDPTFIANDTWSAHDKTTAAVFHEADALRGLVVLGGQLEEPLRGPF